MRIKPRVFAVLVSILSTLALSGVALGSGMQTLKSAAGWLSSDLNVQKISLPAENFRYASDIIAGATPILVRLGSEKGGEGDASSFEARIKTLIAARQYGSARLLVTENLQSNLQSLRDTDQKQLVNQERTELLSSWGVDRNIIEQAGFGLNVPIFYLHHVVDDGQPCAENSCSSSIYKSKLDEHLAWLQGHGYHSIDFDQLSSALRYGAPLPSKPYMITFDDGYMDVYRYGLPILNKHNVKATLYVMPGLTGKDNNWYMDWPQIDDIRANYPNISIENHTFEHKPLKGKKPSDIFTDINSSKMILESRLSKPVKHFCYPYGLFDDTIISQVSKSGALTATTTIEGTWQTPDRLYSLRRTRLLDATNIPKLYP